MAELPKVKEDTEVVVDDDSPPTIDNYLKKQSEKMPSKQQLSKITEEFKQKILDACRQSIVDSILTAAKDGNNMVYINLTTIIGKKLTDDDFKILFAEFKQRELTVTNVNQYGVSNTDIFKISW